MLFLSQNLDQIFQRLTAYYFGGKQHLLFDLIYSDIENTANNYFRGGQNYTDHDKFFSFFTPIWLDLLQKRRYHEAIGVWNVALKVALQWEKKNKPNRIHKGTPYYFLGVTAILNNELENGFLLMHQALEEDKITLNTKTPLTPAYYFVTLDYTQQKQFFRHKVETVSHFLSDKIDIYVKQRSGGLTINQFKAKFLECPDLEEEVFLFVFLLFKLKKLIQETAQRLKQNTFSSLIHLKTLFDLCLVLEKAIEYKNPASKKPNSKLTFANELKFLSKKTSLTLDQSKIGILNKDFKDFNKTLQNIMLGTYPIQLSNIERDLTIAYGIRNFAAHRLEDQPVLYEEMEDLSQSLLNDLFFTIERLY